jgi:hypothetical protein
MRTASSSVSGRERAVLDAEIDRMAQIVEHSSARATSSGVSVGRQPVDLPIAQGCERC